MSTKKEVYKMLFKESKTELAAEKIELALIDDVDKALDKANQKRRRLEKMAEKIATDFNELQADYVKAFRLAKKGEEAAKEIGADDARKFFGNRGDEASFFKDEVAKAGSKIAAVVNAF